MIRCVKCDQVEGILKAGFIRGRQRYFCKTCDYYFTMTAGEPVRQKSRHQVTIVDLARELGVSPSTISRALHGHSDINPETRRTIVELARQLDYQPNQLAYSLVKSRTNTVGIIVPEFFHAFFPKIIAGAQQVFTEAGYNLIICHSNESYQTERTNVETLLASRVDGLLVSLSSETNSFEHLKGIQKRGIPLVLFNRVSDELVVPKVVVDDRAAAFRCVEHLIKNGYRRIAHLAGPSNLSVSRERLAGYREAMQQYGVPVDESLIIPFDLTAGKARIYARHLLDLPEPPHAVFAVNDPAAIEVMQVAKERGVRIPHELAVVGFSNDPISAYIEPGLTTVAQPTQEIGRSAARLLLDKLARPDTEPDDTVLVLHSELLVRGSSQAG